MTPADTWRGLDARAPLALLPRIADLSSRLVARMADAGIEGELAPLRELLASVATWRAGEGTGAAGDAEAPTPTIDRIRDALGLGPVELDVVVLAGLAEEHEAFGEAFRLFHPRREPRPTMALAAQLTCRTQEERRRLRALIEGGPLGRSGLLVVEQDGPFPERSVALATGMWAALQGILAWPAALAVDESPVSLHGLDGWFDQPEVAAARRLLAGSQPSSLLVLGDPDIAFHRAAAIAAQAGIPHVRVRMPADPTGAAERLIQLHALARGLVPIVSLPVADGPSPIEPPSFAAFPRPVALCGQGAGPMRGARPVLSLAVRGLAPVDRARMWRETLPELAEHATRLTARCPLDVALAGQTAIDARAAAELAGRAPAVEDVLASVRVRSLVPRAGGVQMIRPTAGWERLVLRDDRARILREAVNRLLWQHRVLDEWRFLEGRPGARGVRMLFAGPPGTGKTLSAEIIAGVMGVDLLVVDISRVVSKWIGETEKNLAQVFDAAERSAAVLLFDEADAIFGRRTKVSDAHDRYANLETAYLLARLERFEGMTILSTNARENLDHAFLRRLEFVVDFDVPNLAEREAIWRCHVPATAPTAPDVNYGSLASHYVLAGGPIRNAAVAAAFLAAADDQPISQRHFIRAIEREYEKSGRTPPDPLS